MNTKIADLMAKRVITAQPHHSIEHVRGLMQRNRIHSVPVVGPENVALGIVYVGQSRRGFESRKRRCSM